MDLMVGSGLETASFSMGCFWKPEARLGALPGIIHTRVGYAGGQSPQPNYYKIGDHIETIQVQYDPRQITFPTLLDFFWNNHNPSLSPYKRQYTPAVYYHNTWQQECIQVSITHQQEKHKGRLFTEILPMDAFFLAEDHHQKYSLRSEKDICFEYECMYPDINDFVNSAAVTKANGYIGGFSTPQHLVADIHLMGLTKEGRQRLTSLVEQKYLNA